MASKSDFDNTRTNIVDTLPDVYRSDVNKTIFEASFNKFLTKDDTQHVAGIIGTRNPAALVNRQLPEPTPHRSAFQLAPVMYSVDGTQESTLTFKGFQQQMQLMGADVTNMDEWASTERFNWIPPVNLDMLVNYTDYFWKPTTGQSAPQHFTIENRCNKATSKLNAYKTIIARRGATMDVVRIDFAKNALVIQAKHDDLFVDGFMFNTGGTNNINLASKTWVSSSATYDGNTDETSIVVTPTLAIMTDVATEPDTTPVAQYDGQWWYKYSSDATHPLSQLYVWNGASWAISTQSFPCIISLTDQEAIYQAEVNCACESDTGGFDTKQWDDNQRDALLWNEALLADISWNDEAAWLLAHNNQTSAFDLWYDTSEASDELKQRNAANTGWDVVQTSFSQTLVETAGTALWDASVGCTVQEHNQWTTGNAWVHKSELTSFVGAKRAQVPILEYSSQTELNEWTYVKHQWKYRTESGKTFQTTESLPNRLELEPIKSYVAENIGGVWYLYMDTEFNSANRDIDYTATFTNGFKFRIVDATGLSVLLTTQSSIFREIGDTDPIKLPRAKFVTVVELQDTEFHAPELAGAVYELTPYQAVPYTRIEPIQTSLGHPWKGYHTHWVLDTASVVTSATSAQMVNPYIKRSDTGSSESISLNNGSLYVTETYQEFTPSNNTTTLIQLHSSFLFNATRPGYYAVAGENALRVYVNGARQYGTYTEVASAQQSVPDYTIVDGVSALHSVVFTPFRCVYAVQFHRALSANDTVRIEVAAPSFYDMGMYAVPVRTVEDDVEFQTAIAAQTQPVFKSLVSYERNEQTKTAINQYPQFNIYDIVTGEVVKTSPIFSFVEDSNYGVDPSTQRRIVTYNDGKEYQFEQHLTDSDNGQLFAYRSITEQTYEYWYNPLTQTLKKWDGHTWASKILLNTNTGLIAYTPVVSTTEPTSLLTQHRSIWVNPAVNTFLERDAINGIWTVLDGVTTVATADPTLETIWKRSVVTPLYTPQFVDKDGAPVTKGSSSGDWEVISQWKNNPEHENHQKILFSQLITHLTSIVTQQERVPGLTNRGIFTLRQEDYDFGVGGTIKEHNGAFDTLISAINVTEMTPVSVIRFAQEQYASNLVIIRDIFTTNIVDLLAAHSGDDAVTITSSISDFCRESFATNDFISSVYGDTTAYNTSTTMGMPNWIATAPMFGLAPKVRPHIITSDTLTTIVHHDGHRSSISYTLAEQDRIIRQLVASINTTQPGMAVISATAPTGPNLPVFWYYLAPGHHSLYKLKSSATQEWELIDLVAILGQVYLDIETRLYDASPDFPTPVFDFAQLTATNASTAVYNQRRYDRFMDFVAAHGIKAPLINTGYSLTDPYTWNYIQSIADLPPTSKTVAASACWQSLYETWYGTPYPHLEPWCLQGYTEKPLWWDAEYADPTQNRRWKYNHATATGMWENIRTGKIPSGYAYPNSEIISTGSATLDGVSVPSYAYFSVNISDTTITGGYAPDALLPPYYDNSVIAATLPTVRSIFRVFTTQIVSPSSDFAFGDRGPTEWEWLTSGEHVYDRSVIAFLMQPASFLEKTFGITHVTVGGLNVDLITKKVYNHKEAMFHGDVYDTNKTYTANGINQWYVNYNRFNGHDTNIGFRNAWTTWVPRQSYQTAGIIDTSTVQLFNKDFVVTNKDYDIVLANSGVLTEKWIDAFDVSILNIPAVSTQYNNQSQWKFSVDTLSPVARAIDYYGVQIWPFLIDRDTDVLSVFTYNIAGVTASSNTFAVRGNQTAFFLTGTSARVAGSSTNDGVYEVVRSSYDTVNDITNIRVLDNIATSVVDGVIDIPSYSHNWTTGDIVVVQSTSMLPYPLEDKTPYYVIKIDAQHIQLAASELDASLGIAVDITSVPIGDITVGKVKAAFQAFNGSGNSAELWYHFDLNTADVRTLQAPDTVVSMQALINIFDGYKQIQEDRGVVFNNIDTFIEYDSDTGMPVSWQLEVERFIDWAYSLRRSRLQLNDRFAFVVSNTNDNTLRFTTPAPAWAAGSSVALTSSGSLPQPLFAHTPYYIKPTDDPQVFKLCVTKRLSDLDVVDISSVGSGNLFVALYKKEQAYPSFEINPNRNNVWFSTPQGMLSNVLSGPYSDIRVSQTIYDQYGRHLTADKLMILREDQMNRVTIKAAIPNDVQLPTRGFDDPYNYVHIGGGHFFTEGYEHIIMFNNYSVGGDLVYDPFLGLNTKRFDIDYYEKLAYTMRPTLGGYYLTGNLFKRNIEGSIEDMRRFYDAFDLTEGTTEAQYARHLLGYHPADGGMSFLDLLNTNSKSQFLFYRGMIQAKGSVNSINAFINSKKFVDAKMDEFWAYKIADFGDSRSKIYPQIRLHSTDCVKTDIRLKFTLPSDIDANSVTDAADGFETVSFGNGARWVDFPQQRAEIASPLFLDASVSSMTRFYITQSLSDGLDVEPLNGQTTIDHWVHIQNGTPIFRTWVDGAWNITETDFQINTVGQTVYLKLNTACDGVRVLRQRLDNPGNLLSYRTELMNETNFANGYTRVNSEILKFESATYAVTDPVDIINNVILVDGETANRFTAGDKIAIGGVVYTVRASEYANVGTTSVAKTHIYVAEPLPPTCTALTHFGFADILIVFTVKPAADKINPARLLDTKSHTKLNTIPLWHPAYGIHSPVAAHNVDITRDTDPARYNVTTIYSDFSTNAWASPEVGTTWFDTSSLGYLPYYDDVITPSVDTRIHQWGKLADWSTVRVYQWVESLIHPDDWASTAAKQQGDITIPQSEKVSGTPRKTVFKRTRTSDVIDVVVGELAFVQQATFNNELFEGAQIYLSATAPASLPAAISAGVPYYVYQYNASTKEFKIVDESGAEMDVSGPTQLTIVTPFADTWIRQPLLRERTFAAMTQDFTTDITTIREPNINILNPELADGDIVDVYVNGVLLVQNVVVTNRIVSTAGTEYKMVVSDIIDIVRLDPTITPEQLAFNPTSADDGETLVQWSESVEYTQHSRVYDGINYTFYYFWVDGVTTQRRPGDNQSISSWATANQLAVIPTPYLIVQDPVDDLWARGYDVPPWDKVGYDGAQYTAYNGDHQFIPQIFYRKAVLSDVSQYVNEDNRFAVEFTRDLTLRDTLETDHTYMNVKNQHEKWFMFRRSQISAIPQELWVKMTEALMECRYDDYAVRVPSFEREHYDLVNGTETKYGLGTDQIFVNPEFARATLISYLQDPTHDFKPIDVNHFFETYPLTQPSFWKNPAAVKEMCDFIFNTFDSVHTNGIWFDILSDALVTKAKYKGLMKTSWLALHGIRILDVGGQFDDY